MCKKSVLDMDGICVIPHFIEFLVSNKIESQVETILSIDLSSSSTPSFEVTKTHCSTSLLEKIWGVEGWT